MGEYCYYIYHDEDDDFMVERLLKMDSVKGLSDFDTVEMKDPDGMNYRSEATIKTDEPEKVSKALLEKFEERIFRFEKGR